MYIPMYTIYFPCYFMIHVEHFHEVCKKECMRCVEPFLFAKWGWSSSSWMTRPADLVIYKWWFSRFSMARLIITRWYYISILKWWDYHGYFFIATLWQFNITMENHHYFSHEDWWFSIVMLVFQRRMIIIGMNIVSDILIFLIISYSMNISIHLP